MTPRRAPLVEDWESLCDPLTGRLPTAVPLDTLWVPGDVTVQDGVLCFDFGAGISYQKPPAGLLEQFIGLHSDRAIQSFAKRYGPLALGSDDAAAIPQPQSWSWSNQRESLKAWRRYQREFNTLLGLAAAVRERTAIDRDVFAELEEHGVSVPVPRATIGVMKAGDPLKAWPSILDNWSWWSEQDRQATAARLLTTRTSTFIRWCGIRPAVTFDLRPSGTTTDLLFQDALADSLQVGLSLFGALTVQLLAATTGAGFAICSACGRAFVPLRRKPAYGRRRYCTDCGRAAAVRDAKADQRARERGKNTRLKRRRAQ